MYNQVYVQYARTLQFSCEAEWDPTHTDVLWHKYTVRVRGFVVRGGGDAPGLDSALTLSQVKAALETPRAPCRYLISDHSMVEVSNPPDAKIGPEPLPATVTEVTSGMFMVECGFIARIVDCDNECDSGRDPVVSIKWTQSEAFDSTWHSRITTSGRLIVRSDLLQSADNFRPRCTPSILQNYIRETASYTLSPDGTMLDFSFVDIEQDVMPPALSLKATGSFTIVITSGVKRTGQVDLTLQGPPGNNRNQLMTRAIAMGYTKLKSEGFPTKPGGDLIPPIINGSFTENLFQNSVKISMQAMLRPMLNAGGVASKTKAGAVTGSEFLDTFLFGAAAFGPPGVKPPPAPKPQAFQNCGFYPGPENGDGLAPPNRRRLASLLAAAFNDPCACLTATEELKPSTISTAIITAINSITRPAEITVAPLPELPPGSDVCVDDCPYDHFLVEPRYEFDSGSVMMPSTGVGQSANVATAITVAGISMSLVVFWTAKRSCLPPQLPSYQPTDQNLVPLGGEITPQSIDIMADLISPVYSVSGKYRYGVLDPSKVSVTAPLPPFLGAAISPASSQAAGSYKDSILWQLSTSSGPNPFIPGAAQINAAPPSTVPDALSAGIFTAVANVVSSTANIQPSQQSTQQGGAGGGTGGAVPNVPVVNP